MAEGRGRVICVFGPPGAGVSTVCQGLCENTASKVALIRPNFGDLEEQVRGAVQAAEIVVVDGYPNVEREGGGVDGIQYLYDKRIVFPGSGGLVRVMADNDAILRRGAATRGGIDSFYGGLGACESRVRTLGLPYFVIHNDSLVQGVLDLAYRAGVTE